MLIVPPSISSNEWAVLAVERYKNIKKISRTLTVPNTTQMSEQY